MFLSVVRGLDGVFGGVDDDVEAEAAYVVFNEVADEIWGIVGSER